MCSWLSRFNDPKYSRTVHVTHLYGGTDTMESVQRGVDGDHEEKDEGKPLRSHTGLSYSTVCSRGTVHSKSLRLGLGLQSNRHIKENASVVQLLSSDSLS